MSNPNIHVTQNVGENKGTVIGVQVTYQGEPVTIPSEEEIQLHRAELTQIENYNRWADEFYIHEEGKVLPLFASPYEDDTGRKREDLLQTIRAHDRLLVLGEPGMGKTVAMERIVWETAQADEPVVPIFVPLLYFQGTDLAESIRIALNETRRLAFDNLKSVRAFLRETKCLILFDGLNEVPGKQREQVVGAIANLMREYPEHRYVVTSRSQDELWRKLRSSELIQDAVVVQNISDEQAQGYLEAHLGRQTGQALYNQLDDSLKALARTPLLLKLIKDACQGSDKLPHNRGELFDKFVMNKLLEREQKLELVETPDVKKKALAHLAFALQLNRQLACDREWVEKVLVEKGLGVKTDTLLKEAFLHGLLFQQTLPGKQLLRFVHQSVQEYFVALMLLSEVSIEKNANVIQVASRRLSKHNLSIWAKDTWWLESFVQLAGLVDDVDWLVRKVVNVSPWLAWWCVQEGGSVQESTERMIEVRSIDLLNSNDVMERRESVRTLARMKNPRAIEPLLVALGDEDEEVVRIGNLELIELGDAVRPNVSAGLKSKDKKIRLGCIRYLGTQSDNTYFSNLISELVGQQMLWVPPGGFLMGSDKSKHSGAGENELPQHSLYLPGFWIGRYPVTVAQWRDFVLGWEYDAADRRSYLGADDHPAMIISWSDAMAYCDRLRMRSGLPVTLPSEAEWEKTARGTDGRIYPWGNNFDKNKCNSHESEINGTTQIGQYSPVGDSPYGCADMAGNIWEWTRSRYSHYPYDPDDGREELSYGGSRILRGGSFGNFSSDVSTTVRYGFDYSNREIYAGFRVVISPSFHLSDGRYSTNLNSDLGE